MEDYDDVKDDKETHLAGAAASGEGHRRWVRRCLPRAACQIPGGSTREGLPPTRVRLALGNLHGAEKGASTSCSWVNSQLA